MQYGSNTITGAVVSVTSTATSVAPVRSRRTSVTILNESDPAGANQPIRVGGSGVTFAANGIRLKAGESITIDSRAEIFAIANSGQTVSVSILDSYS